MRSTLKNNILFLISLGVILTSVFGCDMLQKVFGSNKLSFCEKYIPESDYCEGNSNTFTVGSLVVLAKLKDPVGTDEVYINIKDRTSGNTVNNFPFTVAPDMKYINFKGVAFTAAGSYTVSLMTRDGTVLASSDIEITG